jgi:5S rRNA maturation endonuclease (ribonuclease M5)
MLNSLQALKEEIEKIREVPFIVEGIKDKKQLEKIGLKEVFAISGKPVFAFVEELKKKGLKKIVILTDFDDEGNKKAKELTKLLQLNKILVDQGMRRKFKSLFGVNKIEELNSLTKLMGDGFYEITSINDKIFNRGRIFMRRNCRKARRDRSAFWSDRGFARIRS